MVEISFVDPETKEPLRRKGDTLVTSDGRIVAPVVAGVPRFVPSSEYAESFGWQWSKWHSTLSDARSTGTTKIELILKRTQFERYDLRNAALLECGMGGGDDTEALLQLPLREIHSFDLSHSVDRASRYLKDGRLTISQASILKIPYPDQAFDVVFCHRVLQHTPSPAESLRSICRKVRRGGILFAHSYKRSFRYLMNYKYKYRPITRRLETETVFQLVDKYGPALHSLNSRLRFRNRRLGRSISWGLVPFEWIPEYGDLSHPELLELEKLVTFDALTPRYDRPMSWRSFSMILEDEGFAIEHLHNPAGGSPLYATARRVM